MKPIIVRVLLTFLVFTIFGGIHALFDPLTAIALSNASVDQLANTNSGAIAVPTVRLVSSLINWGSFLAMTAAFVAIWLKPFQALFNKALPAVLALVLGASMFATSPPAEAYYDKVERGEYVEIGPNYSAFLIPMTGANKTSQAQFGSVEYLTANKLAAKRVEIPHVKAVNTGVWSDYYIPAAKLYLLDRTPVHREWVGAGDRGTSAKNEGFHFESADSLNISTGITITAFVKEEDAAKFFYWFGAKTGTESQDPAIMFASVVYGRSLANVVDTVVRSQVQATLAKEFGKRMLDVGIKDKAIVIDAVLADVKTQYAEKGITVTTLGYAESLTFDKEIQEVMNQNFIANRKLLAADAYKVSLDIETREAEIMVKRSTGMAIQKWNGQLNFPSFVMISEAFMKTISGWFGGDAPPKK